MILEEGYISFNDVIKEIKITIIELIEMVKNPFIDTDADTDLREHFKKGAINAEEAGNDAKAIACLVHIKILDNVDKGIIKTKHKLTSKYIHKLINEVIEDLKLCTRTIH